MSNASCAFCNIITGKYTTRKLFESARTLAFLDIGPLSRGHALVIPKHHGEKLADIPDESLTELLPVAKKVAIALGAKEYNLLQNNGGELAHQKVDHVHIHVVSEIPKPTKEEGLIIGWPAKEPTGAELDKLHEEILAKM